MIGGGENGHFLPDREARLVHHGRGPEDDRGMRVS